MIIYVLQQSEGINDNIMDFIPVSKEETVGKSDRHQAKLYESTTRNLER